jgi:DNA-binding response OmpR family regulator
MSSRPNPSPTLAGAFPARPASWSILVVDDEPELARLLCVKVQSLGHKAQSCAKVSDAMLKLNNQKFDCVLLDLRLEQGSGERIVDSVRSDPGSQNFTTPIFVMSGNLDAAVVKRLGPRVSGVFVKPFDVEALMAKLASLLR